MVNAQNDINEESLRPMQTLMPLLILVLNIIRVMDVLYKDNDEYTHVNEEWTQCFNNWTRPAGPTDHHSGLVRSIGSELD